MSNLRLINETQVSSSVSNVHITDVFSADFDNYKIIISNTDLATSGSNAQIILRYSNASGSLVKDTDYDFAYQNVKVSGSTTESYNTNQSAMDGIMWIGEDSADSGGAFIYVFSPYKSDSYTYCIYQSATTLTTNNGYATKGIGILEHTYSMGGFQLLVSTGTIDVMTIKTYGLRVD